MSVLFGMPRGDVIS